MEEGTYAGQLGTQNVDSVVETDETNFLHERLSSKISNGFASSAYWGATGELPPREPDDVAGKKPHCFEMELNRKVVPFPEDKTSLPRILDYSHVGLHRLRDGAEDPPKLNEAQLRALEAGGSASGDNTLKRRGLPLLERTTTQGRTIGKGILGPEALNALREGNANISAAEANREQLKSKPFTSADPNAYRPTSWDYCDMTGIDPSSYWVTALDQESVGMPAVYKSRYNLVEKEGPMRRERTTLMLERGKTVDKKQLRDTLDGINAEAVPQGYKTWSAGHWMSTTHDAHAPYDIGGATEINKRNATMPLPRTYHTLTPVHEETVLSQTQRHLNRHNGKWATEYSVSYKDSFDKAEVNKAYSKRSIFDIRDGAYTMHPYAHHPRDDTATGENYTPAQIVPGQYTSIARQPLHARNAIK
ncbi:hypothetical protein DPX39_110050900 [Trypanosoma brucei equiperdum]|uniref:Uncharacterized protein n=1 Tax=Trypanosoma brucei equiperdum TaxID=630700 RepID=A0A3L6KTT7_9TRYP|nr:hypothetical protein DPX39_110050900 [Trypanosoma brucei equiperdum]